MYEIDFQKEKKEIIKRYRALLRTWYATKGVQNSKLVRKAFNMAYQAHFNMRRRTGEPYIYHPLEVARIVAGEIGLGETAIISALLHDVVEDNHDYTLDTIRNPFGDKVTYIVDGLTKIKDGYEVRESSAQAENIKKMLLTLSDDVRVILIKLADRLHNMRTLDAMPSSKQQNIAAETLYLYAPLAHRLGLYVIKGELEDLALKYNEPEIYRTIRLKLEESEYQRTRFVQKFILPIRRAISAIGLQCEIDSRTKSVYSIYNKMQKKDIPFEEIYDLFAIRIIIDSPLEEEKFNCLKVYSVVTDMYTPKQNRVRDWVSTPKANGYESIHTTVMSHTGEWVEVQIRTIRMHEIAERGYAAHWKYKQKIDKDKSMEYGLDEWLSRVREILKSPDSNALSFLDSIKLTLFSDEVFVWTPKGHLKSLPSGSTALDFAFHIHSELGKHCIGIKVNRTLVPLNHILRSGDQVEVIASQKSLPKEEWLGFVKTARAREKIKESLKEKRKEFSLLGKEKLEKAFLDRNIKPSKSILSRFSEHMGYNSPIDYFYQVYLNDIDITKVIEFETSELNKNNTLKPAKPEKINTSTLNTKSKQLKTYDVDELNYIVAECCHPIPGDEIIAYQLEDSKWIIHRVNCKEAISIMSRHADKIIHAKWPNLLNKNFLGGIKISGFDRKLMISDIIRVVSDTLKLNIRSFHIDTNGQLFEAYISLYVSDIVVLMSGIEKLKEIEGVETASRMIKFIKT